jgi:hypothetical protein
MCRNHKRVENSVNILLTAKKKKTFTVSYFEVLYPMKQLQTKYYAK